MFCKHRWGINEDQRINGYTPIPHPHTHTYIHTYTEYSVIGPQQINHPFPFMFLKYFVHFILLITLFKSWTTKFEFISQLDLSDKRIEICTDLINLKY